MFGGVRMAARRRGREEGEKPFWISFSDLMSALMVLFLVAMSVALLAVTTKVSVEEKEDKERTEAIAVLMDDIKKIVTQQEFEGIRVIGNTIDFGPRGRFDEKKNILSPEQVLLLRQFTHTMLDRLRSSEAGKRWFKRAVVEGYASRTGTYQLPQIRSPSNRSRRCGRVPSRLPKNHSPPVPCPVARYLKPTLNSLPRTAMSSVSTGLTTVTTREHSG